MIIRVDDRLIHGQVIVSWVKRLNLERIIVVDDNIYNDEYLRTVNRISVPEEIEIVFIDVKGAIEKLSTYMKDEKTIVLVQNIKNMKSLIDNGVKIEKFNLGGVHYDTCRKRCCDFIYLTDEEKRILKEFRDSGIKISVQAIPTEMEVSLENIIC